MLEIQPDWTELTFVGGGPQGVPFTLTLMSNELPHSWSADSAIRRRIVTMPFVSTWVEGDEDVGGDNKDGDDD